MSAALLERYVLVGENDASLRELYRSALRAAGYAVVAVEDGIDALRRVERARPEAVVLDLDLPRLSGRDVQKELKAGPTPATFQLLSSAVPTPAISIQTIPPAW